MDGGALKANLTGGKYKFCLLTELVFAVSYYALVRAIGEQRWGFPTTDSNSLSHFYPPSQNTPGRDHPLQTVIPGHTAWFRTSAGEERQRTQHKKGILGSANIHVSELPLPHSKRQALSGCQLLGHGRGGRTNCLGIRASLGTGITSLGRWSPVGCWQYQDT